MTRRRAHEPARRYGDDDNVPRQGLLGIGIVTVTSLVFAAASLVVAVVVALLF